jgi:hypothetical protein
MPKKWRNTKRGLSVVALDSGKHVMSARQEFSLLRLYDLPLATHRLTNIITSDGMPEGNHDDDGGLPGCSRKIVEHGL